MDRRLTNGLRRSPSGRCPRGSSGTPPIIGVGICPGRVLRDDGYRSTRLGRALEELGDGLVPGGHSVNRAGQVLRHQVNSLNPAGQRGDDELAKAACSALAAGCLVNGIRLEAGTNLISGFRPDGSGDSDFGRLPGDQWPQAAGSRACETEESWRTACLLLGMPPD